MANIKSKRYALSAGADMGEAWQAVGEPAEVSGQPARKFRKQIFSVGTYMHPFDGWKLPLTADRGRAWARSFAAMKGNGVEVPLCEDHRVSAATNRGWVTAVEFDEESGKGFAEIEAIGDDAIRMVARNGASVCVEPVESGKGARDGLGNDYGEAITHIALTPIPVIPGMDPAEPVGGRLAASRETGKMDRGLTELQPLRYYAASLDIPEGRQMDESKLRELLGLADDADESAIESAIKSAREGSGKVNDLTGKIEALTADKQAADAKIAELSEAADKAKGKTLDQEVAEDRGEAIEERLDLLAENGKITSKVAASLKPLLAGASGKRPAFLLSRHGDGNKPLARQILDVLAENDPAALVKEMTGPQSGMVTLSREQQTQIDDRTKELAARADAMCA